MTWAQRRKFIIIMCILLPIVIALTLFILLRKPQETCFDRLQNQNEEGIDCGGICGNVCQDQVPQPVVQWTRLIHVINNFYAVTARIQHPHPDLTARNVSYLFKLYDAEGILVAEQPGKIDILPLEQLVIFETGLKVDNRTPVRAVFELTSTPYWENYQGEIPKFQTVSTRLDQSASGPRVTAQVRMMGKETVEDLVFIVLLYDSSGIVYQAAQTFVERIDENTPTTLSFTWPEALPVDPTTIEIAVSSYR